MTALRCWPGAIAYLTNCYVEANNGRLVECLRLDEPDADGAPVWWARSLGGAMGAASALFGDIVPRAEALARDDCLRPILPPPEAGFTDTPASRDLLERMRQSASNHAALRLAGFPVLVD